MSNLVNYFKTDSIFHNDFIDNLETVISTHPKLSEEQKEALIKPFYEFYEYPKKLHNKKENVLMPIFKTTQDKFGLLTVIKPLEEQNQ
jgi:hypothetical protein